MVDVEKLKGDSDGETATAAITIDTSGSWSLSSTSVETGLGGQRMIYGPFLPEQREIDNLVGDLCSPVYLRHKSNRARVRPTRRLEQTMALVTTPPNDSERVLNDARVDHKEDFCDQEIIDLTNMPSPAKPHINISNYLTKDEKLLTTMRLSLAELPMLVDTTDDFCRPLSIRSAAIFFPDDSPSISNGWGKEFDFSVSTSKASQYFDKRLDRPQGSCSVAKPRTLPSSSIAKRRPYESAEHDEILQLRNNSADLSLPAVEADSETEIGTALLQDEELRAILESTEDGNNLSRIAPSLSYDTLTDCESDDGLREELGALDHAEEELRRELASADTLELFGIFNGVSKQQKVTPSEISIPFFASPRRVRFSDTIQEHVFAREIPYGMSDESEDGFVPFLVRSCDDFFRAVEDYVATCGGPGDVTCVGTQRYVSPSRQVRTSTVFYV